MADRIRRLLLHPRIPLLCAALAFAMGLPFLGLGFQADDFLHRVVFLRPEGFAGLFGSPFSSLYEFADGDPGRMESFTDRGLYPWFTSPELLLRFWRPLTVATHALDYALWPDIPALMHLHSLLWFALAVYLAGLLYRRMMGPTLAAGLAVLLFALDDAHALPAGWIANRNSPVALVFGLAALLLHDRWRQQNDRGAAVSAVACFLAALLAREASVALAGYFLAYALFIETGRAGKRAASLLPYAVAAFAWRAYYDWAGYGAALTGGYIDPLHAPLRFLGVLATRLPLLLNAQLAFPPSDFHTFSPPQVQPFLVGVAVVTLAVLLPFFLPLARRDPLARFWALGALLALVPVCASGPMDRLLDFCGLGAMGLMSRFITGVATGELAFERPRMQSALRTAARALIAVHVVLAPVLFLAMMGLFALGNRLMVDTARNALPEGGEIEGRTVVLANVGNYPIGFYIFLFRSLSEQTLPARVRSLGPPTMAAVPLTIERTGPNSLRVTAEEGYGPSVFRAEPGFHAGEVVELEGLTIRVEELRPDGWPKTLSYEFAAPLEDASLFWLEVQPKGARRFTPPALGASIRLSGL